MSDGKRKTFVFDLVLIVPIIIIASVLLIVTVKNRDVGSYAVVKINGEVVGRYSLNQDGEYSFNKGSNIILIQDGYVMMKEADCPDKTCKQQGKINMQGQSIVCLPNKMIVTVEQEQGGFDFVI